MPKYWHKLIEIPWREYYGLPRDFPKMPELTKPKPILLQDVEPIKVIHNPKTKSDIWFERAFIWGAVAGVFVIIFGIIERI